MRKPGIVLTLLMVMGVVDADDGPSHSEFEEVAEGIQAGAIPFDSGRWDIDAEESRFENYLGEDAVRIKGGFVTVRDLAIQDAMVEFDMAVSSERGFAGVIFRVQDSENYEHFYLRPHLSGETDATQYTPVINGVSGWQLYSGEGFGSPVDFRYDGWMHVKIVYAGDRAEVFVDSDEPVLKIGRLKRVAASGGVGLGAADFSPAYFSNFSVSPLPKEYRFSPIDRTAPAPDADVVTAWQVSAGMPAEAVHAFLAGERKWYPLLAEDAGVANLARAPGIGPGRDTVVARLVIDSAVDQRKGLSFGYSDAVTVYFNGVATYSGTNRYQSRDYRYLGTIGLFDRIFLPLQKGKNEVLFSVTEDFGGWGIMARLDDMNGVTLHEFRSE